MTGYRIDKWLWGVRVFKTRSAATAACKNGHVKLNGKPAKPSASLRIGQTIVIESEGQRTVVEVIGFPRNRLSASEVDQCCRNFSPRSTGTRPAQTAAQRILSHTDSFDRRPRVDGGRIAAFLDQLQQAG